MVSVASSRCGANELATKSAQACFFRFRSLTPIGPRHYSQVVSLLVHESTRVEMELGGPPADFPL
ncbi:MAG: hypothetical protein ABI193_02455 [Minicystis sp.]